MKRIVTLLAGMFVFSQVSMAYGWSLFGPSSKEECILKYQKLTRCEVAARLVNQACDCKFGQGGEMLPYVADCVLDNVANAQTDVGARSMLQACKDQGDAKQREYAAKHRCDNIDETLRAVIKNLESGEGGYRDPMIEEIWGGPEVTLGYVLDCEANNAEAHYLKSQFYARHCNNSNPPPPSIMDEQFLEWAKPSTDTTATAPRNCHADWLSSCQKAARLGHKKAQQDLTQRGYRW